MNLKQTIDENIEGLRAVIEDDQIFDFYKDVIKLIAEEYATECVKASLEKASEKATLLIEMPSGSNNFRTGQLAYIAYGNEHFEVDKSSITSPDNIVLL